MTSSLKTFSTPYGEIMIDVIADAKMASVFERGDYHQKDTVELLSALVTSKDIFVDGGAHIGTITIPLARRTARTIAYEADAATCSILRQNIERNGVVVEVREKGIGAEPCRGEMVSVREGNAGAHTLLVGQGGAVEIVALDDEMEAFNVLKLDVEGMELSVLRGAERIIHEAHPAVLFEVNLSQLRSHHTSLRALSSFFHKRQYRLYLPLRLRGTLGLGLVPHLSFVALCMYPGAYLFHRTSSVFDILALPEGASAPLPVFSVWRTMRHILEHNLQNKVQRLLKPSV